MVKQSKSLGETDLRYERASRLKYERGMNRRTGHIPSGHCCDIADSLSPAKRIRPVHRRGAGTEGARRRRGVVV